MSILFQLTKLGFFYNNLKRMIWGETKGVKLPLQTLTPYLKSSFFTKSGYCLSCTPAELVIIYLTLQIYII